MHKPTQPLCIIPARGGSKRFPRKNSALLQGKPLLAHAIETAQATNLFDRICVTSEDNEMLAIAGHYPTVDIVTRKAHLATDTATVKDVCLDLLDYYQNQHIIYSSFVVLLPTSPLRTPYDVQTAYQHFVREEANFLLSLVPYDCPPQWAVHLQAGWIHPYFGHEALKRRQELEPLYKDDGMVLIARTEAFVKEQTFYGSKTTAYYPDPARSVDIDHPQDLLWAEFLLTHQHDLHQKSHAIEI